MAKWLRRWCFLDMKCTVHDQEVICLNPIRVKLGMSRTYVKVVREQNVSIASTSVYLRVHALRKCDSTFL